MRNILTPSELHKHSESELSALFRRLSLDLNVTEPGSAERRNALASLENIQREQATRNVRRPRPPGF
jgi:hypothetical protein